MEGLITGNKVSVVLHDSCAAAVIDSGSEDQSPMVARN